MKIPCPHCKSPTTWEENPWRPFCSERCRMIDLGKWVQEEYRVPQSDEPHTLSEDPEKTRS
ncbi:MAG TPA: DNA gyrase inhibitor YacG [Dissulfurispiraceae bacterium]|nr:DNA gyrase inhibitor YacG [Dissulfurispiraceae bacterium]